MAINFWAANEFNYYILENMNQSNVTVSGRLYVNGDTNIENVTVASAYPIDKNLFTMFMAGSINVLGGTNTQNTGMDTTSTVTNYTMNNLNGIVPQPQKFELKPTDVYAKAYFRCISVDWALLPITGSASINETTRALTLTGTDPQFNNFLIDSSSIQGSNISLDELNSIDVQVPSGSTVMISFTGNVLTLNTIEMLFNSTPITLAQASTILMNFPEATNIVLNSDIHAALLAPFADVIGGSNTIYGTLIVKNISGLLNGYDNLFTGTLPELYNPSTTKSCSSFTTSTSTTTTTTTTTTSTTMSTTTTAPLCQAKIDVVESVALQQTALSHIINAEGEKIQKALSLLNITPEELLSINSSVESLLNSITVLEIVLQEKISTINLC